ncbi:MAG: SGNH/GDSL hydrolase family protein [Pseudomonadota bacterium]
MIRFAFTFIAACLLAGAAAAQDRPRLLAMGDSIMAWNSFSGRSIGHAAARALDADLTRVARAGAQFTNDSGLGRAAGFDIRAQYPGGRFDVILINGGANDMGTDCDCRSCTPVLDALIAPHPTGEVPALLSQLTATGAEVIWVGYYKTAFSRAFLGCTPFFDEMEARLARLAGRTDGLTFLDSEVAIDPRQRANFAADALHPSPRGSARIAALVAQRIGGL